MNSTASDALVGLESSAAQLKNLLLLRRFLVDTDDMFAISQEMGTLAKFLEEDKAKLAQMRTPVKDEDDFEKKLREQGADRYEKNVCEAFKKRLEKVREKNPGMESLYETRMENLRNMCTRLQEAERKELGGR